MKLLVGIFGIAVMLIYSNPECESGSSSPSQYSRWDPPETTTLGEVTGWVIDARTDEPIAGVAVCVDNSQQQACDSTGESGESLGFFRITRLEPGTYTLTATHPGYETNSIRVPVRTGSAVTREVYLHKD